MDGWAGLRDNVTVPLEPNKVDEILHEGVLVREGRLNDLISIENQTELILEDATPELLAELAAVVNRSQGRLVEQRKPQTTLERYFLEVTTSASNKR